MAADNLLEGCIKLGVNVVRFGRPVNVRSSLWNHTIDARLQQRTVWIRARQQLDEAVEHYRLATQAEPNNPGHWYWLAQTHLRKKETAQAIQALQRTAELFPAHYETRKQLQKEHGRLGQYSQAADHAGAGCGLPGAAEIMCARHIQLLVNQLSSCRR